MDPGQELEHGKAHEISPELSEFIGTLAGSTPFEVGEPSAKELRFVRFERSMEHAKRAKAMLDEAGIAPRAVPLRTLVPLIESASLEDDDGLTDQWAALLANAAGGQLDVPPSFPRVLRDLEPIEASIMDYAYNLMMQVAPELRRTRAIIRSTLSEDFKITEAQVIYHTDNLVRLRLLGPGSDHVGEETRRVTLTELGRAFVRACRPPSHPDPPIRITDAAQLQN